MCGCCSSALSQSTDVDAGSISIHVKVEAGPENCVQTGNPMFRHSNSDASVSVNMDDSGCKGIRLHSVVSVSNKKHSSEIPGEDKV